MQENRNCHRDRKRCLLYEKGDGKPPPILGCINTQNRPLCYVLCAIRKRGRKTVPLSWVASAHRTVPCATSPCPPLFKFVPFSLRRQPYKMGNKLNKHSNEQCCNLGYYQQKKSPTMRKGNHTSYEANETHTQSN